MNDITLLTKNSNNTKKTLAEQRLDLQFKLQMNRRLLIDKFSDEQINDHFPRSATMRLLTQKTTLHMLKKLAFTAVGIKTITSIKYGFSIWKFLRNRLPRGKTIVL
jgi:hypothetical protein